MSIIGTIPSDFWRVLGIVAVVWGILAFSERDQWGSR